MVVCHGKSHRNADLLSRLQPTSLPNIVPLDDNLLDADLFEVDALFFEYVEILTYLETNQTPAGYSPQ